MSVETVREPAGNTFKKPKDVAIEWGVSPRTLEGWRLKGGGPPYVVLGSKRAIRYRQSDLDEWLDSRTRVSTSDPGRAA